MAKSLDEQITQEARRELTQEKKDKQKINYLASFPNLVDLVENEDGKLEYLVVDPTSKKPSFYTVIEIDGKVYQPPTKNLLPYNMLFPQKDKVSHYIFEREKSETYKIESNNVKKEDVGDDGDDKMIKDNKVFFWDTQLYDEIVAYYQERAELPEDSLYDLITTWAFHTYAMEKADFSPIIYFLGLPEKGKSRMLKSMVYIARRGLRKISLTDAQILRDCTHIDATLALDMMNLWQKVEKAGSEDVFLNRPERGVDVSRVNRPEKGAFADTDYYIVFGPTIFATNESIHEILDTRAIPIIMVNSKKDFEKKVVPEDSLDIKEKLTAWRASTMLETWKDEGRIAKSRLGDITQPLYQVIRHVNPARADDFKAVISEIEKRRVREKADSMSGQILLALITCQATIENGCIKGQTIANEYNKGNANSKYNTQSRTILNRLRAMGFDTQTMHGGNMGVVWNDARIESLKLEFGIDVEILSPSSETSPTSLSSPTSPEPYWLDET